MLTSDFDFTVPDELIAQYPVEPRDHARLMVIDRRLGTWEHRIFTELPEILRQNDVLVRNNTRVIPARLIGHRLATGGKWEGLFLRECNRGTWEILATSRGKPALGERLVVGEDLHLLLEERGQGGSWIVQPQTDADSQGSTFSLLSRHGQTPLPPYICHGREVAWRSRHLPDCIRPGARLRRGSDGRPPLHR